MQQLSQCLWSRLVRYTFLSGAQNNWLAPFFFHEYILWLFGGMNILSNFHDLYFLKTGRHGVRKS